MKAWRKLQAWFGEREMVKGYRGMRQVFADYRNGTIGAGEMNRRHHDLDGLSWFRATLVLIAAHVVPKKKGKKR